MSDELVFEGERRGFPAQPEAYLDFATLDGSLPSIRSYAGAHGPLLGLPREPIKDWRRELRRLRRAAVLWRAAEQRDARSVRQIREAGHQGSFLLRQLNSSPAARSAAAESVSAVTREPNPVTRRIAARVARSKVPDEDLIDYARAEVFDTLRDVLAEHAYVSFGRAGTVDGAQALTPVGRNLLGHLWLDLARTVAGRKTAVCTRCKAKFELTRSDRKTCSEACQKAMSPSRAK